MNKPDKYPPQGEGHAVMDIADYLEGRLSLEREGEIERHLSACEECAADFDYARGLIDAALRSGETHILADRLVEITENLQAEFTLAEWDHFQECPPCQEEAARLQYFPEVTVREADEPAPIRAPSRPTVRRRAVVGTNPSEPAWPRDLDSQLDSGSTVAARFLEWLLPRGLLWTAGGVAVLILVLTLLPGTKDTASLAQIGPIAVTVPRSVPEAGSFSELWTRGLETYVAGNYEAAEIGFALAREIDSLHVESALLQGSCQLLLGNFDDAVVSLKTASDLADTPERSDEASWQLANALLAAKQETRARTLLTEISAREGLHQADATTLLAALGERG